MRRSRSSSIGGLCDIILPPDPSHSLDYKGGAHYEALCHPEVHLKKRSDLYRRWFTLESMQYDTLEEAKAAFSRLPIKADRRIAEAYTVVRYKPVKV